MNYGATEQEEAYFIPVSSETLNPHRQSFCITKLNPFVLVGAAVASSVALWALIFCIIW